MRYEYTVVASGGQGSEIFWSIYADKISTRVTESLRPRNTKNTLVSTRVFFVSAVKASKLLCLRRDEKTDNRRFRLCRREDSNITCSVQVVSILFRMAHKILGNLFESCSACYHNPCAPSPRHSLRSFVSTGGFEPPT